MVECHYKWENFLLVYHQKLFHSYWHMKVNKNFCNRAKIPVPDSCKRKVNIIINLHPLSDVEGNTVTKGEDEVLNVVFAPLFNSKTSCSLGAQAPWPGRQGWEQNEASTIPGDAVSNLLLSFSNHLNTHKSMGPGGIHPRVLRDLAEELTEPPSIIYQLSWLTWGPQVTGIQCDAHLQERSGGGSGELSPVCLTLVPVMEQIILGVITNDRYGTTRGSGPASMDLGRTGPA